MEAQGEATQRGSCRTFATCGGAAEPLRGARRGAIHDHSGRICRHHPRIRGGWLRISEFRSRADDPARCYYWRELFVTGTAAELKNHRLGGDDQGAPASGPSRCAECGVHGDQRRGRCDRPGDTPCRAARPRPTAAGRGGYGVGVPEGTQRCGRPRAPRVRATGNRWGAADRPREETYRGGGHSTRIPSADDGPRTGAQPRHRRQGGIVEDDGSRPVARKPLAAAAGGDRPPAFIHVPPRLPQQVTNTFMFASDQYRCRTAAARLGAPDRERSPEHVVTLSRGGATCAERGDGAVSAPRKPTPPERDRMHTLTPPANALRHLLGGSPLTP